jgi:hypothetical protein
VHCSGAVQSTSGLVQHDDGRVDQQLVADGDALALTTTDATPEEAACREGWEGVGGEVCAEGGGQGPAVRA